MAEARDAIRKTARGFIIACSRPFLFPANLPADLFQSKP
jgi:hypothetical protein